MVAFHCCKFQKEVFVFSLICRYFLIALKVYFAWNHIGGVPRPEQGLAELGVLRLYLDLKHNIQMKSQKSTSPLK